MNQGQWDVMSDQEKFDYLNSHEAKVSTQSVMNGRAKVGDPNAIRTVYTITRGGVETGSGYTLNDANEEDKETLQYRSELLTKGTNNEL